jgi:hypothetical protein
MAQGVRPDAQPRPPPQLADYQVQPGAAEATADLSGAVEGSEQRSARGAANAYPALQRGTGLGRQDQGDLGRPPLAEYGQIEQKVQQGPVAAPAEAFTASHFEYLDIDRH